MPTSRTCRRTIYTSVPVCQYRCEQIESGRPVRSKPTSTARATHDGRTATHAPSSADEGLSPGIGRCDSLRALLKDAGSESAVPRPGATGEPYTAVCLVCQGHRSALSPASAELSAPRAPHSRRIEALRTRTGALVGRRLERHPLGVSRQRLLLVVLGTSLQGVAILIDDFSCLPDCALSVAADFWALPQMLRPRPVITSRPFLPPSRFSLNDETGMSGTVGNVVTSLPLLTDVWARRSSATWPRSGISSDGSVLIC